MASDEIDPLLLFEQMQEESGTPWTRQYYWRLERAGLFPKRIKLGPKTSAWRQSEIRDWVAARIEARSIVPTAGAPDAV